MNMVCAIASLWTDFRHLADIHGGMDNIWKMLSQFNEANFFRQLSVQGCHFGTLCAIHTVVGNQSPHAA